MAARVLINAMFWTIVVYFIWHSLHAPASGELVQPVYRRSPVAAAVSANLTPWEPRWQRVADFCRRWALPSGVVMFALLIVQANTGALSCYRRDATVRSVGVGWRELASEIEAVRARVGATCVLAPDYGTTGWLAFYLPKGTCVAQQNQRIRWVNMPEPDKALLAGKLLYVHEVWPIDHPLKHMFAHVEKVAEVARKRGPLTIETYALDVLAEGAKGRFRPPSSAGTGVRDGKGGQHPQLVSSYLKVRYPAGRNSGSRCGAGIWINAFAETSTARKIFGAHV